MNALQFKNGQVRLADVAKPSRADEAIVRVLLSGICNTDLEIARGYAGFEGTLGHEFVGVVEEAPGRSDLLGKRVVGEINAGCGKCSLCRAHDPRHCPTRTVLGIHGRDGAHAEFLSLPMENLLAVPDEVSDEEAVFVEPLAAAYGIYEQVPLGHHTRVAIIGDGKLGLLVALSYGATAGTALLVGKHDKKLAIARNAGIETCLLKDLDRSANNSFDVVVEASGSASGFATALDLVRQRGKIVLKSTFSGEPTWAASRVVVDEITIVGSRCGRFEPALKLLGRGKLDLSPFISDEFRLTDGVRAMERAAEPGVLKVLLRP
ncbi:MAG: threonine dehydrogenase-like Zn-dependent dehydrogenase [Acidobacteria bacterium OLB17]|nr:MAG: threonine dehydrogenase-like Zn-dependent dehydrogenase [Acidobacteria bacterium OLB17]MCZ2389863.1 alcohol dehydrogenase catalytic domain-containing protein [Acidobacteriota bacterium]